MSSSSAPSSLRAPSATRTAALLLSCLLLLPILTACGKKGDPMPPLRTVPIRADDLAVRQQGSLLVLDFSYPATTTAGLALDGIDAVELFGLPVPPESAPLDARQFETQATELVTLRGAELEAAVTGSRIQLRVPLETPIPADVPKQVLAVRTLKNDEASPFSNRAEIVPRTPPAAPDDLSVTAEPEGVRLAWTSPDSEAIEAFEVYRRGATERSYGPAIARVDASESGWLDTSARYDNRYFYSIRSLASTEPPIESTPGGEREIDYRDRFAPPLPTDFVALAEGSRIRLRWTPPAVGDLAGVVVWRREPGRDFHRLGTEPVSGGELVDTGLAMGLTYEYRVQAVDRSGNEGELSDPVRVTLR